MQYEGYIVWTGDTLQALRARQRKHLDQKSRRLLHLLFVAKVAEQ